MDWGKIKRVRRYAYLLILVNIALGYLLFKRSEGRKISATTVEDRTNAHIVARRGVKLRVGPDAGSGSIATIADKERVTVVGDSLTNGWMEVVYQDQQGWVWGDYVEVE
ncbi:SH3 domain-containing protein [Mucilaginibacter conchicola]|uniref:SH3 domain-containing protein n=1 Tax=Mucilaginibacter conchicola TaxID=2303333 RepID=A0A372NUD6_9SPHI|nr:SH3 domain-containing protein [Mucilaginibacter conchicola]